MDRCKDTTVGDEGGIGMAMVGTLQEFCPETESITAYLERVELFMKANKVEDKRRVAVLLSVMGSKTYNLLRSLLSPDSPGDKSYADLETALKAHFEPKPSVIPERFHCSVSTWEMLYMIAWFVACTARVFSRDCWLRRT